MSPCARLCPATSRQPRLDACPHFVTEPSADTLHRMMVRGSSGPLSSERTRLPVISSRVSPPRSPPGDIGCYVPNYLRRLCHHADEAPGRAVSRPASHLPRNLSFLATSPILISFRLRTVSYVHHRDFRVSDSDHISRLNDMRIEAHPKTIHLSPVRSKIVKPECTSSSLLSYPQDCMLAGYARILNSHLAVGGSADGCMVQNHNPMLPSCRLPGR